MNSLLKKYANSNGHWLLTFDFEKIPVYPLPFEEEGIVTAMYFAITNKMYIAEDSNEAVWFGTLVHELYHAYQRHSMGLVKYLFYKTFRRKKLEEPAKEAELDAVEWYGNMELQKMKEELKRRKKNG